MEPSEQRRPTKMFSTRVHRHIYLVLLTLLGGCMVTSVWAANLMWVLMGVNWLLEGRWREKWHMARESRLLQALLALFALHLVGMLWTDNVAHGWSVLQVKLPLLVVPLVMLTTPAVKGRARGPILALYTGTVLVVSIIGAVRLFTIPDLPYRNAVPYISHIRFALNCCMVIFLLLVGERWNTADGRWWKNVVRILISVWLLTFLVMLRSYTALAVLAAVSLALAVRMLPTGRWQPTALWLLLAVATSVLVGREVKSYYRMVDSASAPLQAYTAGGRPYTHARDGIIENGNYINNYVCCEELRAEWQRRSNIPYDSTVADGYSIQPTLIRYLNALGLTKDSVGVNTLSEQQIHDIEHGVANPVYVSKNPIRKMVYVMLFEREFYNHTHTSVGFTMLQRIELWKAALHVVGENRWIGVGTGDVDDALHAELAATGSDMAGTYKSTHNQYLSFLAAFGIVGFSFLLFMFIRPLATRRPSPPTRHSLLMLAWLLTILISFLTEDTLDTLAGILFCTWLLAFRKRQETEATS